MAISQNLWLEYKKKGLLGSTKPGAQQVRGEDRHLIIIYTLQKLWLSHLVPTYNSPHNLAEQSQVKDSEKVTQKFYVQVQHIGCTFCTLRVLSY